MMKIYAVFEVPTSCFSTACDIPSLAYGNPIYDEMTRLADECAEIFSYSWGVLDSVSPEHYFDHDYSPENAFIGLGLPDDHLNRSGRIELSDLSAFSELFGEVMAMRKSVEAVAERFDADVLLLVSS